MVVRLPLDAHLPLERGDESAPLLRGDLRLAELRLERLHGQLCGLQRGLQPVHLALQPRRLGLQPAVLRRLIRVRVGVRVWMGANANAGARLG